jgi:hypothetical protein
MWPSCSKLSSFLTTARAKAPIIAPTKNARMTSTASLLRKITATIWLLAHNLARVSNHECVILGRGVISVTGAVPCLPACKSQRRAQGSQRAASPDRAEDHDYAKPRQQQRKTSPRAALNGVPYGLADAPGPTPSAGTLSLLGPLGGRVRKGTS